jgi:hypothetical protein
MEGRMQVGNQGVDVSGPVKRDPDRGGLPRMNKPLFSPKSFHNRTRSPRDGKIG